MSCLSRGHSQAVSYGKCGGSEKYFVLLWHINAHNNHKESMERRFVQNGGIREQMTQARLAWRKKNMGY